MSAHIKKLFIISVALLFSACTSNNDDSVGATTSGQEAASYAVSGLVVKGGVAGSTVTVHSLGADGVRGDVVATASTDGSGAFKLVDPISGPAEVVATGGSYKDEATGATVDMTGRELNVILLNGAAKGSTVAVTPLTRIAASQTRLLISLGSDLTAAVNKANEDVTYQFGIADLDITSVPPLDLSASSGGATALTVDGIDLDSDAARYGLVILGLSQTAKDEGRPPEHVLDLVDNIATDMANSVLDEGDQLPYNDFPRSPGNTLCELGDAIDDFLGGGQNPSGVTPTDVDHKTYPNGVDCGNIAAAPPPVFSCTNIDVVSVTPSDGEVTVKWGDKDQAPGYDLRYDMGFPTAASPIITDIWRGANTHTVTGLTNGEEYCFGARMDGCSFGGQELCTTPNGPDGGSCQQDCGDLAKAECVNDTSGECFYYTFMYCATGSINYKTKSQEASKTELTLVDEIGLDGESCGNNECQFEYCLTESSCSEYFESEKEELLDYDGWSSCMVSCVESNEAGSLCEMSLWPSGAQGNLACGVTVTDGGADDADGKVNGCIEIFLNWTEVGNEEYELFADYNNNGTRWNASQWYDSGVTSGPPFRLCEDACLSDPARHQDEGLPCQFTDNYRVGLYDYNYAVTNECAITFDFPALLVE